MARAPAPDAAPARPPARLTTTAIVWKRSDFRESSRIVTLLTRDHGRIGALAKGAHRPDSPFLGRLDFLNEVRAVIGPDRGGLRLLLRVELLRERRALRAPRRYLAAAHLAELCDFGLPTDAPEPAIWDLLTGGLNLLELCPPAALPLIVLGLELRFLAHLGALPDLERCAQCSESLADGAFTDEAGRGLHCRRHAPAPRHAVGRPALDLLCALQQRSGRQWPELLHAAGTARATAQAASLPARWLWQALERRCRLRPHLFAAVAPATD